MTDTVTLYRDAKKFPESNIAIVCEGEVEDWKAMGWAPKAAKAPKDAKGDTADLIAAVVDILDPLDRPNEDANGLTLRQLRADIAGLGLDVDPNMSAADLMALRDLHREERAQDGQ